MPKNVHDPSISARPILPAAVIEAEIAGKPARTSMPPAAPMTLTGTQSCSCAETAGSTPAVSTDRQTMCRMDAMAPTTSSPPLPGTCAPTIVGASRIAAW